MTVISATGTVTVVSDSGVEAQAIVVFSTPQKIRVNMQGVAMDFLSDPKGNWTARLSGLTFLLLKK